jgi:hypothetical protein
VVIVKGPGVQGRGRFWRGWGGLRRFVRLDHSRIGLGTLGCGDGMRSFAPLRMTNGDGKRGVGGRLWGMG